MMETMEKKYTGKRYILPALFLASVYGCGVFINVSENEEPESAYILFALLGIAAVLGIANMIYAFLSCRRGMEDYLRNAAMLIKYGAVPAFIYNFLGGAGLTAVLTIFIGPFSAIIGAIFAAMDYFMLFTGSCYVISYLILKARAGEMTIGKLVLHGILQLIFVVDVADTMYLTAIKEKKGRVAAVLTLVFMMAVAVYIVIDVYNNIN